MNIPGFRFNSRIGVAVPLLTWVLWISAASSGEHAHDHDHGHNHSHQKPKKDRPKKDKQLDRQGVRAANKNASKFQDGELLKLAKAGLGADVLLAWVESLKPFVAVNAETILKLRKHKIPKSVIVLIVSKGIRTPRSEEEETKGKP